MQDILAQYANLQWKSWWMSPISTQKIPAKDTSTSIKKEIILQANDHKIITAKKVFKYCMDEFSPAVEKNDQYIPFTVGDRTRYATCSGVAWISNHQFVTVNLYGQHLQVYDITDHASNGKIRLLYEMRKGIQYPETVSISPNKKIMAISHTMSSTKGLSIHNIECNNDFDIKYSKDIRKGTYHSLCFSPNSRFLAATEIGKVGFVEIIDLLTQKTTFLQPSRLSPLRPKSVAISPNGDHMIVVSGSVVKQKNEEENSISVLSLHRFDQRAGVFEDKPLAEIEFSNGKYVSIEDSCVIASGDPSVFNLICVDQANDKLQNFSINLKTLKIEYIGSISNDVSFPHGIDLSPSGEFLSAANYGDNSIRIIQI
jgi:hypothetical protein